MSIVKPTIHQCGNRYNRTDPLKRNGYRAVLCRSWSIAEAATYPAINRKYKEIYKEKKVKSVPLETMKSTILLSQFHMTQLMQASSITRPCFSMRYGTTTVHE